MTEALDTRFTQFLLESQALKFGSFTLKSGRQSPYFINAGAFDDGAKIATLGEFYAEKIQQEIAASNLAARIDTVFGPAKASRWPWPPRSPCSTASTPPSATPSTAKRRKTTATVARWWASHSRTA